MHHFRFFAFFFNFLLFLGCSWEHSEEIVVETYEDGSKKTTLWQYPDGDIDRRIQWYSNGIKQLELEYKDNKPHGNIRQWTYLGDLILEGTYKNGQRTGTWTSLYRNKKKQAKRYFKDDHEVGDWVGYHPNGEIAFEEHYNDRGDSIGVWKKFHENGKLAEESTCFDKAGKGYHKKYRNDGTMEFQGECMKGSASGKQVYYFTNGKRIQREEFLSPGTDGKPLLEGERTFYYGGGQVQKREFWQEGVRKGTWEWYSQDGRLLKKSLLQTDSTLTGIEIRTDYGICADQDSTGQMHYMVCAESTFVDGKLANRLKESELDLRDDFKQSLNVFPAAIRYTKPGNPLLHFESWENRPPQPRDEPVLTESRSYFPDTLGGGLASQSFWKEGKREGVSRNWYSNGALKDSLSYAKGERMGEQFGFDSTGKMTIHKTEKGKNGPVIMHILGQQ